MNAEDLVFDESREAQVVEDLRAVSPYVKRSVFSETLVIKSINLGDLPAFVVSSDQVDAIWIADLRKPGVEDGKTKTFGGKP